MFGAVKPFEVKPKLFLKKLQDVNLGCFPACDSLRNNGSVFSF